MLELKDLLDIPIPILTNIFGITLTLVGSCFAVFKFIMIKIDKEVSQLRAELMTSIKKDEILPRILSIEEQIHNILLMLTVVVSNIGNRDESN